MNELKNYIKQYFINNNIPLINQVGNSTVDLVVDGYRSAGWSAGGQNYFLNKWFPDRYKNRRVYTYILDINDKQYCSKCKKILNKNLFRINNSRFNGLQAECKDCHSSTNKKYYKDNKAKHLQLVTKRKISKIQQTPKWADQKAINFFYECCPKGCHVDHIVPLQGKNISGLHIETNLQWLPAKENLAKGNKWDSS